MAGVSPAAAASSAPVVPANRREIGGQAVWSLSSCKQGFGVDQLRDGSTSTYWQSDGPQPHQINIQFLKKTTVTELALFVNYKQDESYTPNKLSIRAGTSFHDLREIDIVELMEPEGWLSIPLANADGTPLRTHMIQIAVLSNHQNGRDTHMRLVNVYSNVSPVLPASVPFTTIDCTPFCFIR